MISDQRFGSIVVSILIIIAYSVTLFLVLFRPENTALAKILEIMAGSIIANATTVVSYWVGSSSSSRSKDERIANLTPPATPPSEVKP